MTAIYTGHDPRTDLDGHPGEGCDLLRCGHPKTPDNYRRKPSGNLYCATCNRAESQARRERKWAEAGLSPINGWGIGADGRRRNEERFWSMVDMHDPVVCWPWLGPRTDQGYGIYSADFGAHRASYGIIVGEIPDGLEIDHLCNRPWCVNPYHLEPVTRAENAARRARRTTRCIRGHEFTPENTARGQGQRRCKACTRARDEKRQGFRVGERKPRGHSEVTWDEFQALAPVIEANPAGGWVTVRLESGRRLCAWCPPMDTRMPEAIDRG